MAVFFLIQFVTVFLLSVFPCFSQLAMESTVTAPGFTNIHQDINKVEGMEILLASLNSSTPKNAQNKTKGWPWVVLTCLTAVPALVMVSPKSLTGCCWTLRIIRVKSPIFVGSDYDSFVVSHCLFYSALVPECLHHKRREGHVTSTPSLWIWMMWMIVKINIGTSQDLTLLSLHTTLCHHAPLWI